MFRKNWPAAVATPKFDVEALYQTEDTSIKNQIYRDLYDKVYTVARQGIKDKKLRKTAFKKCC